VTAFNLNLKAPLIGAGLSITTSENAESTNPKYQIHFALDGKSHTIECFSKLIRDESNPKKGFLAVMTCRY